MKRRQRASDDDDETGATDIPPAKCARMVKSEPPADKSG